MLRLLPGDAVAMVTVGSIRNRRQKNRPLVVCWLLKSPPDLNGWTDPCETQLRWQSVSAYTQTHTLTETVVLQTSKTNDTMRVSAEHCRGSDTHCKSVQFCWVCVRWLCVCFCDDGVCVSVCECVFVNVMCVRWLCVLLCVCVCSCVSPRLCACVRWQCVWDHCVCVCLRDDCVFFFVCVLVCIRDGWVCAGVRDYCLSVCQHTECVCVMVNVCVCFCFFVSDDDGVCVCVCSS